MNQKADDRCPGDSSTSDHGTEELPVTTGDDSGESRSAPGNEVDPSDLPYGSGITAENPHGCSFCEKAFASLSHLHKHEESHISPLVYKCSHCSRQFRHRKSCERHEKLHSADRKYRCKICGVGYSRSDHLRNHMKSHASEEGEGNVLKCPVCTLSFSSSISLSSHLKEHNEDSVPELPDPPAAHLTCSDCHEIFPSQQEMRKHLCSALADEECHQNAVVDLKCPVCYQSFSSMESLCEHLLCHQSLSLDTNANMKADNSAAFDVEENNKENTGVIQESPGGATTPVSSGSGSGNPLVCPYCLIEGFDTLESLQLHLTSIHNVKRTKVYTCIYCNAPYPNLYSLHDHMTVVHRSQHGLDITYPCSLCIQRFHSLDALAKHKGIVHSQHYSSGIDAAFCNRCNMTLSGPESLEDHMASVHNIIMDKRPTKTKGKKSVGKNNTKGTVAPSKPAITGSSRNVNSSSQPKKQSLASATPLLSPSLPKQRSSSSPSSSSLATSPVGQNSSTSPSLALAFAMSQAAQMSSALQMSNALQMSALIAKKASLMTPNSEQSLDPIGSAAANLSSFDHHREGGVAATGPSPRSGLEGGTHAAAGDEITRSHHECIQCKASFPTRDQLEAHVLLHYLRVSTEYGCSSCSKNFSKPDELQRHLMDIHAHHLYRCSLCKEIFDSKVNIQVHFAIKHSDECKLYRCEACELNFRSEMEWQVHVRVNHLHISRPYRCLFCQESFTSEVELQCHLTTHSKPFVCPMCSQAFHIEYLLDQHMQQNHGDIKPNLSATHQHQPTKSSSPSSLSLIIPTTIKQEQEVESQSGHTSPSSPPLSPSQTCTIARSSPLLSKTILKSPKTMAMLNSPCNRMSPHASEGYMSGTTGRPTVWKNAEPLHICNICDIKFNDFNLLMLHKAQDHDLKNLGKANSSSSSDKRQKYEEDANKRSNSSADSVLLKNDSLLSTLTNATSMAVMPSNGQAGSTLSCMFCSQTFKNNLDYEKHMKIHVNSGNLTCSICDETFSSPSVLAEHKLMHCKIHQGNMCVVCRVSLSNKEQFYAHSQEHGFEGTQLQCVICRQSLSSLVELQMHGHHHFQPRSTFFTCCVCLKSFESRENLVSKVNSSGRTYYVCKPCYHGEAAPLHTCSQCSEKFATAQLLEMHMLTHKPSFQCIKCQQSFSSEYEIQLHVATHLMTEGTQHECQLCGTFCDTPARLQTHLIQHSFNGKDITCFVCKKLFESPQEIQVHVLEHSASYRKHACSKCPLKFFFSAELENHQLTYDHLDNKSDHNTLSSNNKSPPNQPAPVSTNFQASALLASLSSSPLSGLELSKSNFEFSNLQQMKQSGKKSTLRDSASNMKKKRVVSSPVSTSLSKVMKLDTNSHKKKGGEGKALNVPRPHSSSPSLRRLECVECHKMFTTGTALANHRKTHFRKDAKNDVKCSLCDEHFPSAMAMQQHFFSTHSMDGRKEEEEKQPAFDCMVCEKTCASLSALQNHILSHRTHSLEASSSNHNKNNRPPQESDSVNDQSQAEDVSEKSSESCAEELEEDESCDQSSFDLSLLACPVCNQVFLNAEEIDDHIKTHEELFITNGNDPDNHPAAGNVSVGTEQHDSKELVKAQAED